MKGSPSLLPIITIEPYQSFHGELLYPKYQQGLIAFGVLPLGLSLTDFIFNMKLLEMLIRIHYVTYNGENVAIYETRPTIEGTEVHACWFTKNRKKRLFSMIEVIKSVPDAVIYVPKGDADGHFALSRKGYLDYAGEKNDMHLFKRLQAHLRQEVA